MLHPPVDLALAKAVESIPLGDVLSGGSVFEMKFDGFRAACFVGLNDVWLYSRQGKDLSGYSVGSRAAVPTFGLVRVQLSVRDRCRSLSEYVDFIQDHQNASTQASFRA